MRVRVEQRGGGTGWREVEGIGAGVFFGVVFSLCCGGSGADEGGGETGIGLGGGGGGGAGSGGAETETGGLGGLLVAMGGGGG